MFGVLRLWCLVFCVLCVVFGFGFGFGVVCKAASVGSKRQEARKRGRGQGKGGIRRDLGFGIVVGFVDFVDDLLLYLFAGQRV